jgi:hypothetical protein
MRHLLLASGLNGNASLYIARYANQVPASFDPYIISYLPLENEDESRLSFSSTSGNVTFSKIFESETVCRCISDDSEPTQNYPRLNVSNGNFDILASIRYPLPSSFKTTFIFTMNNRRYKLTE